MGKPTLNPETCMECGKAILVCQYSPHERASEATGIAASRWGEDFDTYFVGWICLDCAWRHAMTKGDGGILGGGGAPGDWDFTFGTVYAAATHREEVEGEADAASRTTAGERGEAR